MDQQPTITAPGEIDFTALPVVWSDRAKEQLRVIRDAYPIFMRFFESRMCESAENLARYSLKRGYDLLRGTGIDMGDIPDQIVIIPDDVRTAFQAFTARTEDRPAIREVL